MAMLQIFILFTVFVTVNSSFGDWFKFFKSDFEQLQCEVNHRYESKFKVKGQSVIQTRDFIYKLHCADGTATVSYATHMLSEFSVLSCEPDYITNHILVPTQVQIKVDNLPTQTRLYIINGAGQCHYIDYTFNNFEGDRETEDANPAKSLGQRPCAIGFLTQVADNRYTELDYFTNCIKTSNKLSNIVRRVRYEKLKWQPLRLKLDPPGYRSPDTKIYRALLACSYKTQGYEFHLLCLKNYADTYDPGTGEYKDEYQVFVGEGDLHILERFDVTSCWEDDIVSSIFPPRYQPNNIPQKPAPTHILRFSYLNGVCAERPYKCSTSFCDIPNNVNPIACPRKSDADAWFNPTSGKVGIWGNCEGHYSSKAMGNKIQVNKMGAIST